MFILDGKSLSLDRAFTHNGLQYPANWLRLANPEQRTALGITEVPDAPTYDQRFYWGVGNPKDHAQLVEHWTSTIKQTAGTLLAPTDWYITRQAETGLQTPQSVLDSRSAIRALSNEKEAFLGATASTEELASYVTSPAFSSWKESTSTDDTVVIDGVTSSTILTGDSLLGGSGVDTLTF